ncbi:unnamed protein product [Symbiodinium sp. CCMP2592]|nr:unnamed protein product [Symbiodinium sp. CCMP2592]
MSESWMTCPLEESDSATQPSEKPPRKRLKPDTSWMKPKLEDRQPSRRGRQPTSSQMQVKPAEDDWMQPPVDDWMQPPVDDWMQPPVDEAMPPPCVPEAASSQPVVTEIMNICMPLLKVLPKERDHDNVYSAHGKDIDRITQALRGKCGCKKNCMTKFSVKQVKVLASAWHDLSTATQYQVLFNMFNGEKCSEQVRDMETTNSAMKRKQWQLDGRDVCFRAFCRLLGHSPTTVLRMMHGDPDLRKSGLDNMPTRPRPHPQQDIVHHFLMDQYMSAAETLPEVMQGDGTSFAEQALDTDGSQSAAPSETFQKSFLWNLDTSIPERVVALFGKGDGRMQAPLRFLPPGQISDLWYQFLAWCQAQRAQLQPHERSDSDSQFQIPSWSTFMRVWHQYWYKQVLDFRQKSSHAECTVCWEAKQLLHSQGLPLHERVRHAAAWRAHLACQYADRLLYYHIRYASRAKAGLLSLVCDSMDKAKFAYPKMNYDRLPKSVEGLHRPRFVLTAAMCHGHCLGIFVSDDETRPVVNKIDESVKHGADHLVEIINRVVQRISEKGDPPSHLVLQSDNTCSFSKNSTTHLYFSYLVAAGKMQTVTANYLVRGHTHEDIDALFAEFLPVLRRSSFDCLQDVLDIMQAAMQARAENCGEALLVQDSSDIRAYEDWLSTMGIKLSSAFMPRKPKGQDHLQDVPHSYIYKRRMDLTALEMSRLPRASKEGDTKDVFVVCKSRMLDKDTHPPVLVLPHSRLGRLPPFQDIPLVPRQTVSDQRRKDLIKLAGVVERAPFSRGAGSDALKKLASGSYQPEKSPLPWFEAAGSMLPPSMLSRNELFPHLPEATWPMMAKFR